MGQLEGYENQHEREQNDCENFLHGYRIVQFVRGSESRSRDRGTRWTENQHPGGT